MPGRILRRAGVVKVSHAIVPVLGTGPAQVGPWDERLATAELELGLEDIRQVRLVNVRWTLIDEEDGDRPRAGRDAGRAVACLHRALERMQLEPVRVRHLVDRELSRP